MEYQKSIQLPQSPKALDGLQAAYGEFVATPPREDITLLSVYENLDASGSRPLVLGELVLAGRKTRLTVPETQRYPIHFKKTYFPGASGNPKDELKLTKQAADLLGGFSPKAIGADNFSIRTSIVPGVAWAAISPLCKGHNFVSGSRKESLGQGLHLLREGKRTPALLSYWKTLEAINTAIDRLHKKCVHGDLHRNNILMVPQKGGFEPVIIDFETLQDLRGLDKEEASELKADDKQELWMECAALQLVIGKQPTKLGKEAWVKREELLDPRVLGQQHGLDI